MDDSDLNKLHWSRLSSKVHQGFQDIVLATWHIGGAHLAHYSGPSTE